MNAQVRPISSTFTGFFSFLIANFLQFLHTTLSGFGLIGGQGNQFTSSSSFHDCGRTGSKSPCLYVDSCHFFLKFWNNEQSSCPHVLVSTAVEEYSACYNVKSNTCVFF
jgi:hypothetical protein